MFASLKNKIKEETGNDLTKLAPVISSPPQKGSRLGRHSRQGSGSSIGSMSLDGLREDGATSPTTLMRRDSMDVKLAEGKVLTIKEIKRLERREDEWKRMMQKREEEWKKQLEKQEDEFRKEMDAKQNEWKRSLELLEKEKNILETEKREVVKQKLSLEESLKVAEEYKKKVHQYQEDIDQLEGFQTQEMAKIKHLLLVKEQELADKGEALKEVTGQMESLKLEVNRLRRYEEELNNVQKLAEEQREGAEAYKAEMKSKVEELELECTELKTSLEGEKEHCTSLQDEVYALREKISSKDERLLELSAEVGRERNEKDLAQLRCAELNQQCELARQHVRGMESEASDLQVRLANLQEDLIAKDKVLSSKQSHIEELEAQISVLEKIRHDKESNDKQEQELRKTVVDLEEQLADRNKSIRVLQQRLSDMKKTLQRELRNPSHDGGGEGLDASPVGTGQSANPAAMTRGKSLPTPATDDDDVNFKYLKHVLIKFLTSREYEAQHLTRAVATLLRFTPEEERLLRETLEWKMSWFGTRPSLGYGQTAKTIPPS